MKNTLYSKEAFFQVGGTLPTNAPSYVERWADKELIERLHKHQVCLVLAPRQTGKSSLMVHATKTLSNKFRYAIVDFQQFTEIKNSDSFFQSILYELQRELGFDADSTLWWLGHSHIEPFRRFRTFLEDILLLEIRDNIVIFFDEIDSVLRYPFSDKFFATIRAIFNARATNPLLRRLNFVFLGVTSPNALIQEKTLTPFNIGYEIELGNFDKQDLDSFREVLGPNGDSILERIFYWTEGQPYLVQRLSEAASCWPESERNHVRVDTEVDRKFFKGHIKEDPHLKFIRDFLLGASLHKSDTLEALRVYREVLQGKKIPIDESCPHQRLLRLAGIVVPKNGAVVISNRIYSCVFNLDWIKRYVQTDVEIRSTAYNPLVDSAASLLIIASSLRTTVSHPDPKHLLNQIMSEIERFEIKARILGYTSKAINYARYALIATIDEAVLQTPWGPKSVWSSSGLNITFNRESTGGEMFFRILDKILRDPIRYAYLLELMYFCLRLGFKGKYSFDGHSNLAELSERVFHVILDLRGREGRYQ